MASSKSTPQGPDANAPRAGFNVALRAAPAQMPSDQDSIFWVDEGRATRLWKISRSTLYRHAGLKPAEDGYIRSEIREGRRFYFVPPWDYDAQKRLRDSRLAHMTNPDQAKEVSQWANSGQGSFFPILETDREAVARIPSDAARQQALRRRCIIQPNLNHDSAVSDFKTRQAQREMIRKVTGVPPDTQEKWERRYKRGGLPGLVDKIPGPMKGTGEKLDASMKGFIDLHFYKGETDAQIIRGFRAYHQFKQDSPGCRLTYLYPQVSDSTIKRYIRRLREDALAKAVREGPDALHAACGHMDRTYLDLASLQRVESDECKLNLFSFDPRRPVNRRGESWIRRWWLLTFYDARSMYPLVWTLCEGSEYELRRGIALEDELNLFVRLVREFGVPDAIHSDRGRFRGRVWGGEPYQQRLDKEFAPADGIFQRVGQLAGLPEGIRHNMPRVHNPRGTRLERFHRWVADWFRAKPGWVGANTRERKMTRGDADAERFRLWSAGQLAPAERSPLLARDEVLAEIDKMMEAWRDHNSEGTNMNGLTPRAVFVQSSPPAGFRKISDDDLTFATAQHFQNEYIAVGGIIELRDGRRYSHPLLAPLAGQKREVVRLRHDHSFITVLPAQKGEAAIRADSRTRVGCNDPDELARQSELQARLRKLAGEFAKPLEYEPGAAMPEQVSGARCQVTEKEVEPAGPNGANEISGPEFLAEREEKKRRKILDFPDLET